MNNLDPVALDRWITGNYGEDFFSDECPVHEADDPACPETELCPGYDPDATEAEWRYDRDEDRIREDSHLEMAYEDRFYIGDADLDM
jgi:hypothetical protein